MAFILPNIITALSIFYTLMSVSLTVPLLFGLFSEKPNNKIAFISSIIGIIVTLYLQFQNNDKGIWILNAQSTGILFSLIVMIIFLLLKKEVTD